MYQSSEGQGQCIVPLRPDLLAAQLLDSVLQQCQPQVGAWLYQTLMLGGTDQQFLSNALSRLGRLRHDWAFTLRPPHQIHEADPWLDALIQYAQEDFERCRTLERVLRRDYLEQPLIPLAIAVTQAYVDTPDIHDAFDAESDQSDLANSLNNLSVDLAAAGKQEEALIASRRACEMIKPFAKQGTIWAARQKTMQRTLQKLEQGDGHSV